jgi:hypothetical protein
MHAHTQRMMTALGVCTALASTAPAEETQVEKQLAAYRQIRTLSCEIRKDTQMPEGEGRMLSRVYFEQPNRVHVENATPVKRRILCDGATLYYYVEGEPKGISSPVGRLKDDMSIQTRAVPGTAMEHLLRIQKGAETNLPPATGFPERKGYALPGLFAVLSLDATGRLARIEYFRSPDRAEKVAQYDFSMFEEVLPGVWIPLRHDGAILSGRVKATESRRISSLAVNRPLPEGIFDPKKHFEGVAFESMSPDAAAPPP